MNYSRMSDFIHYPGCCMSDWEARPRIGNSLVGEAIVVWLASLWSRQPDHLQYIRGLACNAGEEVAGVSGT